MERNALGDRMGRVHMKKQNLDEAALHHPKALLKRARGKDKRDSGEGGGRPATAAAAAGVADPPAKAQDEEAPPKKGKRKAKR